MRLNLNRYTLYKRVQCVCSCGLKKIAFDFVTIRDTGNEIHIQKSLVHGKELEGDREKEQYYIE